MRVSAGEKPVARFDHALGVWRDGPWLLLRCSECGKQCAVIEGIERVYCKQCDPREIKFRANKNKRRAHSKVYSAIERGELPCLNGSIKCVDYGSVATVYDHREYAKPLDVQPVCRRCNKLRGPAIDSAQRRDR